MNDVEQTNNNNNNNFSSHVLASQRKAGRSVLRAASLAVLRVASLAVLRVATLAPRGWPLGLARRETRL